MSRRRIAAGAESRSSFSLRNFADESNLAAPPPAASPYATGFAKVATPTLNFKFKTLGSVTTTSPPVEAQTLPVNFFTKPIGASRGSGDVMRLTAIVDDLTQKQKKAAEKHSQTEAHLQQLNNALNHERAAAAARAKTHKAELAVAHESESKMRKELASRAAVKEIEKNQFESSVHAALKLEETEEKVAVAEKRVADLSARCETLTTECDGLEQKKIERVEAEAAAVSLDTDAVQLLLKQAAMAKTELQQIETTRARLDAELAEIIKIRDVRQTEATEAAATLDAANAATAAAVADKQAAAAHAAAIQRDAESTQKQLDGLNDQLAAAKSVAATQKPTGVAAPTRLNQITPSSAQKIHALSCCAGTGLPFHFSSDAPTHLTTAPAVLSKAPGGGTPGEQMVDAIVSDLKNYFNAAAVAHRAAGKVAVEVV